MKKALQNKSESKKTYENKKLSLKFEPYKNNRFLFFVTEINVRNTFIPFFASLGVKKLVFMKNKEELLYEISENVLENKKSRYSIAIMTYQHETIGNPAYIASLLQSIKQMSKKKQPPVPFLVYANSAESLEIQFGKTPETRAQTIRAAAKQGLKGLIVGNLDEEKTAKTFVEKIIELLEEDELAQMSPFERYLRKLINRAYAFLNKMFGSVEEKEDNINKAIDLFEEVLEQSKDNCDALLGKAIACSSSSDPEKIREGTELFARLEVVGEDMERVYEGHAGACYKMGELVEDKSVRHKWLLRGVKSLNSLVEWQMNEYKSIKKAQYDYQDPELIRQLSNKYSAMATYLDEIGGEHTKTAINYYIKGIKLDPTVKSNYQVVPILENKAGEKNDFMQIVKICASARKNLPGKEIDFLISEAEAYFNADKQHDATNLYNSINEYVKKDQLETWIKDIQNGVTLAKKDSDLIATFITFLNHRAIYFRKIGNYDKSLNDLNTAISLDMEKNYYDIYFNIAKASATAMDDKNTKHDYTAKDVLNNLFTSITIALNINLDTYEQLLKTIKDDPALNQYTKDIRHFLNNSNYSTPVFFK